MGRPKPHDSRKEIPALVHKTATKLAKKRAAEDTDDELMAIEAEFDYSKIGDEQDGRGDDELATANTLAKESASYCFILLGPSTTPLFCRLGTILSRDNRIHSFHLYCL